MLLRRSIAEMVGTFMLVFAGCGAIMVADRFPNSISPSAIPVVFGLVVASMIYAVGHISGAHFNPAVTLAFAVARHFPRKEVIAYWLAQFTGAITAIGLLHFLLPVGIKYGATLPNIGLLQAVVWEIILTSALMFVIIAVATDTRAVGTMAGVAIGSVVTLCAYVGGPVTGASMNPARSLAPALFEGNVSTIWIYFVGPTVGASLAAILYTWIRCDTEGCC